MTTSTPVDAVDMQALRSDGRAGQVIVGPKRWRPRRRSTWAALIVIAGVLILAVFGPEIAPYSPLKQNIADVLKPPLSSAGGHFYLLGTDDLGRDVLSRMIVGTRPMLEVVLLVSLLAGVVGFVYGLVAAFSPRWLEELLLRIADIQLSIPPFILAVLLAVLISPGVRSTAIAIAVVSWPMYARIVRTDAAKLKDAHFVLSARVAGLSRAQILRKHVASNVLSVFVVLLTFNVGVTIIFESSLSFIGYGVQLPGPDWGNILAGGVQDLNKWWLAVVPGVAIVVLVLATNALGEELRARVDDPDSTAGSIGVSGVGGISAIGPALWWQTSHRRQLTTVDIPGGDTGDASRKSGVAASVEHLIVGASGGDGETSILEDVTVEVRDGERLALVGESGSGKSTICLALLGMLPHGLVVKRGRAVVRDREMLGAPSRHLRNVRGRLVGVVFQDPKSSLDPVRKVGWQIVEARRIHKLGDQKGRAKWADRTLQALGFSDPRRIGQSYPHQLSGGMRQRACIGAAVAAEPRLLLADEPTTALDMSVRGQVLRGLLSYCEENEATLVFVSHDIQVVRAVATRVVVMLGGRVLEEGPASLVLTRPRNPYTQGLLEATVTLDPRRRDEPLPTLSDETAQSQRGTGCPFAGRCGRARAKCAHTFPPAVESEDSNGEAMHHVWCWNPIP